VKRILIIEREYGCGAGEIAEQAAERLGWRLFDRELTGEIAKLAKVDPRECERREERLDSWLYRLGKIFWRGSYEQALPVPGPEIMDADRMVQLVEEVVRRVAQSGQCVLVGRGAPYFLRNRSDTFCVFLFAPRAFKIARMEKLVGSRAKAESLVESVDQGRAAFIKHYFGRDWPNRHLYHLMINTVIGIPETVDLIVNAVQTVGPNEGTQVELD